MCTRSETPNTALKPNPFSPVESLSNFFELSAVLQMARTSDKVNPSSLKSTISLLGVTVKVMTGFSSELWRFASSAFCRSSKQNRNELSYNSVDTLNHVSFVDRARNAKCLTYVFAS